jgi:hypothetical protein
VGCCGQGRAELRASRRTQVARHEEPPVPDAAVLLEHVRSAGGTVRGPATGHVYVFTPAAPVQPVHPGDATALLATGLFRAATP